jgi:hypothetical protein
MLITRVCPIFCVNGVSFTAEESLLEQDSKVSQGDFPVPDRHRPFLSDVPECKIEELQQHLGARELAAVLGQLTQTHVHR